MLTIHDLPYRQIIQTFSPAVLDSLEILFSSAHLGHTFPAATLTVIQKGEVRLNDSWGWIDPETRSLPVQPDTLFDLASVTKLFTTSAFLSQVSAGCVRLDDPLVTIIPEFGVSGPRPLDGGQDPHNKVRLPTPEEERRQTADPARVTFYHLLTHTSGLAPWRDVFDAAGPAPMPPGQRDPISRQKRWTNALKALYGYPFVGQPGEGVVRYSDLGLMLLGEAVSRLQDAPGKLDTRDPRLKIDPNLMQSATQEHEETGGMRRGLGWMLKAHEDSSAGDLFSSDSYGHTGFTGTSLWIDPRRGLVVACLTNRVYPGRGQEGIHGFRRSLHDLIAKAVDEKC